MKKKQVHLCANCGRKLKNERWIYSHHTGNRFCWVGEGCAKDRVIVVTRDGVKLGGRTL